MPRLQSANSRLQIRLDQAATNARSADELQRSAASLGSMCLLVQIGDGALTYGGEQRARR